jgi:dipeptide transport system substrate-binding protein
MNRSLAGALGAALLCVGAPQAFAKTLVFCSEGDPGSLNPQTASSVTVADAAAPVFENLVAVPPGGGAIAPALAQSWDISPDGRQYTFHLRHGVKFHASKRFQPTRDLDADDVVFSFERQWQADNPFHKPASGSFDYFEDMEMPRLLEAIDKVDDYTVRFRLKHAEAPFLADLSMSFAAIMSAEYAAAMLKAGTPDLLDTEPVGTGPFVFESYRKDLTLRYTAFADYWDGRPKVDTLVFSITPNPSVRLNKLKSGECQVMSYPAPDDASRIEGDPHLTLLRQDGLNVGYLAMNAQRPPFNDVRVRRAFNLAIDKATLVDTVYGSTGAPAKNPLPPSLWSYDDTVPSYPYDVEAARKLMVEAGQADGFDLDLWYMPVNRPYNPDNKRVAEMVADDLARIGVRAHPRTTNWSEYRRIVSTGELPAAFFGWISDNGDPDNFLGILLGCDPAGHAYANNIAKWCDPAYDGLIEAAKTASDQAVRADLYRRAQRIAHEQAPWVPLAHGLLLGAVRKSVIGFKLDPFGRNIFTKVDVQPE